MRHSFVITRGACRLLGVLLGGALLSSCTLLRDLDDLEPADAATSATTSQSSTVGGASADGGDGGGGGRGAGGWPDCRDVEQPFGAGGAGGLDLRGGPQPGSEPSGCSDGTRELFLDLAVHPDIAGCSGGFSVPGVVTSASQDPQCNRAAGNDGDNPIGFGCSIADLCAEGFHVCASPMEVETSSGTALCVDDGVGFWATRQSQDPQSTCMEDATPNTNNLVGCGFFGKPPDSTCMPLNAALREAQCLASCSWLCDKADSFDEALIVKKYGPDDGGALCCRD